MYKIWFSFYQKEIGGDKPIGCPCHIMFQGETIEELNANIQCAWQHHDLEVFTPYTFVEILEE